MSSNFKRVIEDFVCEHCGQEVVGDGYTNHCPKCLWSKHVDITPGDRANGCAGLMEPVELLHGNPDFKIRHKCTKCGMIKANKLNKRDDPNAVQKIY